jgi:hypothetical protein
MASLGCHIVINIDEYIPDTSNGGLLDINFTFTSANINVVIKDKHTYIITLFGVKGAVYRAGS